MDLRVRRLYLSTLGTYILPLLTPKIGQIAPYFDCRRFSNSGARNQKYRRSNQVDKVPSYSMVFYMYVEYKPWQCFQLGLSGISN